MKDKVYFGNYNSLISNYEKIKLYYKTEVQAQCILEYDTQVESTETVSVLRVKNTNFRIDGKHPDLMIDEFVCDCGESLSDLELTISREGGIIALHNYQQIMLMWEEEREQLLRYYTDAYSQKYLQAQDRVYKKEEVLLSKIQESPFYLLFFNRIYGAYGSDFRREYKEEINGVDYKVTKTVEQETDENGLFSVYTIIENKEREEQINMQHILDNKTKQIKEASARYLKNGEENLKIIIFSDMEKTQISQEEKRSNKFSFLTEEEENKQESKNKFSFFISERNKE